MTAREVALAWIDAFNASDIDSILALSEPNVVIDGMAGEQHGHEALRARLEGQTYGVAITVTVLGSWERDGMVVMQTRSEVRFGNSSEPEIMQGASLFTVRGGRVARIKAVNDLAAALASAGTDSESGD